MTGETTFIAVVIGASAGGIECLSTILPQLPSDIAVGIVVVIHLPPDRDSLVVDLFRPSCGVRVKEAEATEPIEPGTVYFAPPGYHVLVEPDHTLALSFDEPVLFSRPSIDVLFESAADAYGEGLLGIILTGANSDGANGLRAICSAGGQAIVQDPASAYAPQMPSAALAACPNALQMSPEQIAGYLASPATSKGVR